MSASKAHSSGPADSVSLDSEGLGTSANKGVLGGGTHLNLTSSGLFLNVVLHFACYVPCSLVVVGMALGGNWNWLTFVVAWVGIPIVDLLLGADSANLTVEEETQFRASWYFRLVTWFHLPVQVALVTAALLYIHSTPLSWFAYIGLLLSLGTVEGFGVGATHELIHRPHFFDFSMGVLSLIYSSYGHFWIEHLWGHHKNVGTKLDPASSELGESIYPYMVKNLKASWVEANDIEAKLQKAQGHHPYGPYNRIIQAYSLSAAIAILYGLTISWRVVPFYILQGWIAAALVENTNYIEHYGLRRKELSSGEYEAVGFFHSWDTGAVLTNTLLFKIQRHPDHHTNAGRPYQILRNIPEAPKLPTGYAGMIVLSWFPSLFFSVMNWRVAAYTKQSNEYSATGQIHGKDPFPKERRGISSHYPEVDFQLLPAKHFVAVDKKEQEDAERIRSAAKPKAA
jgi:alkane 1-monooxygenase